MHGVLILLHFPFNTLDSILDFFMEVLMPEITFFFQTVLNFSYSCLFV